MLDQICEWFRNIAVFLVVITAVMHAVPGKDYVKYIRFFSGLILILLLFTPVLKLFGMENRFRELYSGAEYEMRRREIQKAEEIYEEAGLADILTEQVPASDGSAGDGTQEVENRIEVGEIEIGE